MCEILLERRHTTRLHNGTWCLAKWGSRRV